MGEGTLTRSLTPDALVDNRRVWRFSLSHRMGEARAQGPVALGAVFSAHLCVLRTSALNSRRRFAFQFTQAFDFRVVRDESFAFPDFDLHVFQFDAGGVGDGQAGLGRDL